MNSSSHQSNQTLNDKQLYDLNDRFYAFSIAERIEQLFQIYDADDILVTSSFGTKSAVLLSMISQQKPNHPIYFIDTTYHFQETWNYQHTLQEKLNLNIEVVKPKTQENELTRTEKWWIDHPKMCCAINKIAPIEPLKAQHKVLDFGAHGISNPISCSFKDF